MGTNGSLPRPIGYVFAILMSLLLVALPVSAEIFLVTDFDGTWSADEEAEGGKAGTWSTPYTLYRIQASSHAMIEIPYDMPEQIFVSHRDLVAIENQLAQADGVSGSLEVYEPEAAFSRDGSPLKSLIPGYYRIIDPLTFEAFRSGDITRDYLMAFAESELSQKTKSHRGRGESLVRHFLSDADLAKNVIVLTARGHDDEQWLRLFETMQEKEGYKFIPRTRKNRDDRPLGVVALSHTDYANQLGHSMVDKKVARLNYLANRLLKQTPYEKVRSPDGDSTDYYHTIIYQDDDPDYLNAVFQLFRSMATSKRYRIKFVIRNTGTQDDVEATKWYLPQKKTKFNATGTKSMVAVRDIVIRSNGTIRLAQADDLFIDPTIAQAAKGSVCENVLK